MLEKESDTTQEFPQVNLAFSLHSPFTEERNKLVHLDGMKMSLLNCYCCIFCKRPFPLRISKTLADWPFSAASFADFLRPLNRMFPMEEVQLVQA